MNDRRESSIEMCRDVQPKKNKVTLYHLRILQQKTLYPPFITNKTERFSFKSGCVIEVDNDEMRSQLKPKKAKVRLYQKPI